MAGRVREERLQIMLSPEELRALDDFRFERRMPSRAAAVREILKRGLTAEGFGSASDGSKSSDFGVTASASRTRPAQLGKAPVLDGSSTKVARSERRGR